MFNSYKTCHLVFSLSSVYTNCWTNNRVVGDLKRMWRDCYDSIASPPEFDFFSEANSSADQRKRQSSASLAFVRGIHRRPVNSQHKGPVTWKIFSFDDVIIRRAVPQRDDSTNSYILLQRRQVGGSNHWQLDCLFNGFFVLTRKYQYSPLLALCSRRYWA